ncbi:MAG: hypothetical protein JRD89_05315 [Deltaproteobacteria bacterium]|nr:hypothetical protein [Deltaproteobacteria bacterium]
MSHKVFYIPFIVACILKTVNNVLHGGDASFKGTAPLFLVDTIQYNFLEQSVYSTCYPPQLSGFLSRGLIYDHFDLVQKLSRGGDIDPFFIEKKEIGSNSIY